MRVDRVSGSHYVGFVERSEQLESFVRHLYAALADGDAEALRPFFSEWPGALVIGTDPSEWWVGEETIVETWSAQIRTLGGVQLEATQLVAFAGQGHGSFGVANEESVGHELQT